MNSSQRTLFNRGRAMPSENKQTSIQLYVQTTLQLNNFQEDMHISHHNFSEKCDLREICLFLCPDM